MISRLCDIRHAAAVLALLGLAGCASYIDAKREVANAPAAIRAAEVRRDAALDANAELRAQQAEVAAAQQRLNRDVGQTEAQLAQVEARLKKAKAATASQRAELAKLAKRQADLKRDMSNLNQAPAPKTPGEVGGRQIELDNLRTEQDNLQKQIDALQGAL
jgi:chromosome segregation ATPase